MLEPHVKVVAEQQHIDYDFIGLEDDDTEDDGDSDYGYDGHDDGELSFDYSHIEHIQDVGSTNRKSMEVHVPRGSAPHQVTSSSLMAGSIASPSRFAPTGQHGHSISFPAVSISGTHLPASSPSPAASGGTSSAFRDSRW